MGLEDEPAPDEDLEPLSDEDLEPLSDEDLEPLSEESAPFPPPLLEELPLLDEL